MNYLAAKCLFESEWKTGHILVTRTHPFLGSTGHSAGIQGAEAPKRNTAGARNRGTVHPGDKTVRGAIGIQSSAGPLGEGRKPAGPRKGGKALETPSKAKVYKNKLGR